MIFPWDAPCVPKPPMVYLGKDPSKPYTLYTPKADPVCACGGRHHPHECSVHAPTLPPEHDAPDHTWFALLDGGYKWWPAPPNGGKVFRGRASVPPMASFRWRRFCHALLWIYSNTEGAKVMQCLRRHRLKRQPET